MQCWLCCDALLFVVDKQVDLLLVLDKGFEVICFIDVVDCFAYIDVVDCIIYIDVVEFDKGVSGYHFLLHWFLDHASCSC